MRKTANCQVPDKLALIRCAHLYSLPTLLSFLFQSLSSRIIELGWCRSRSNRRRRHRRGRIDGLRGPSVRLLAGCLQHKDRVGPRLSRRLRRSCSSCDGRRRGSFFRCWFLLLLRETSEPGSSRKE